MTNAKIDIIVGLNQIVAGTEPGNIDYSADEKTFVRDLNDKKLYIGNTDESLTEIKTENSHNWAKTFFYGGS